MDNINLAHQISELHAELCSALADSKRLLILYALSEQSLNVGDLASNVGISQPAASRHLKILKERGLVRAERQGASVEYTLTDHRLIEALDTLLTVLRDRINYRANLLELSEE
ncbi:MAG: metalloregulator ArsR/SmtB family transcription factor [Anaerolineales bacterium]|jgi:DNA-binding transcriptional ArsR family regulator